MIFFKFVDPETNKDKNIHRIDINELKAYLLTQKIKAFLSVVYGDTNWLVTHHFVGPKEVETFVSALKDFYDKSA